MCIFRRESNYSNSLLLVFNQWFKILLSAEPHTISPFVKYACMKVKYRFLRAFVFNVFCNFVRIPNILPILERKY